MRFHLHGLVVFLTVHALVAALSALGYVAFSAQPWDSFLYWWGVCLFYLPLLFVSLVLQFLLVPWMRRWAGLPEPTVIARPPVGTRDDWGASPHEATFDGTPVRNGRDMYTHVPGSSRSFDD